MHPAIGVTWHQRPRSSPEGEARGSRIWGTVLNALAVNRGGEAALPGQAPVARVSLQELGPDESKGCSVGSKCYQHRMGLGRGRDGGADMLGKSLLNGSHPGIWWEKKKVVF